MKREQTTAPQYSAEDVDDAAVWMARLRAPDRSPVVERGFQRWLRERPQRVGAFEAVSAAWEMTGALQRRPFPKLSRWERAGFRAGFVRSIAAVAAGMGLIAAGMFFLVRSQGVSTDVGEQRTLTLEDGSRISLNTDSRVVVSYSAEERRIELKSGEALFEVARQSGRPFVVTAGTRQITALGTSFIVRSDEDELAVTLMEGRVAVGAPSEPHVELRPGQRVTFVQNRAPDIDVPPIEKVTAWRRGQIEFEQTALADAVREVNRYSPLQVAIEDPRAQGIAVNGIFRTGDAEGFAVAVARSSGLQVMRRSQQLLLVGQPAAHPLSQASP